MPHGKSVTLSNACTRTNLSLPVCALTLHLLIVSTVMSLSASKILKRLRSLSASNKRIAQRSRLGVKEPLASWEGVRHQVIGLESQTWRCPITGKSIPFAHLNRGLRVSVDACDLVMQDERNGNVNGEFYQHHPEKVNLMPVCLITQNMCSL
jgi:hypothetical protein